MILEIIIILKSLKELEWRFDKYLQKKNKIFILKVLSI